MTPEQLAALEHEIAVDLRNTIDRDFIRNIMIDMPQFEPMESAEFLQAVVEMAGSEWVVTVKRKEADDDSE